MESKKFLRSTKSTGVWRRGVFIDIQNIYMSVKAVFPGQQINYQAVMDYLNEDGVLTTFTAFSCVDPERQEQKGFLMAMALMGYRVVTKPIKRMADGNIKANMDMEIAMEVLDQAPYLDEIVLITGDGDFTSLVNRLVQRGKFVSVIGPDRFTAPELIQACHAFLNFSQIPDALEPRSNEGGRNGSGQ